MRIEWPYRTARRSASAADGGHLLASRTDRERAVDVLKTAFVAERLTKDEFDLRVGQAYASRTFAELAEVTIDIPTGTDQHGPPRTPVSKEVRASACVVIAAAAMAVATSIGGLTVFLLFAVFYFMALLIAGAQVLASRHEERYRRQLQPRPVHPPRIDQVHNHPQSTGSRAPHRWRSCVRRYAIGSPSH